MRSYRVWKVANIAYVKCFLFVIVHNQVVWNSMQWQWYECGRRGHKRTSEQRYPVVDEERLRNLRMINTTSAWQKRTVQLDLYNWPQVVTLLQMRNFLVNQFVGIFYTVETAFKSSFVYYPINTKQPPPTSAIVCRHRQWRSDCRQLLFSEDFRFNLIYSVELFRVRCNP